MIIVPRMLPGFLGSFNRTQEEDPLKVFDFSIEVEGFSYYVCQKVGGLGAETDVIELGAPGGTVRKSPGLTKFGDLTLERGQITAAGYGARDFMDWYKQVYDRSLAAPARGKKVIRRTVEIVQTDPEGAERLRWRVEECWPRAWSPFGDLDLSASNDAMTKIVLVNEGFKLLTNL